MPICFARLISEVTDFVW